MKEFSIRSKVMSFRAGQAQVSPLPPSILPPKSFAWFWLAEAVVGASSSAISPGFHTCISDY